MIPTPEQQAEWFATYGLGHVPQAPRKDGVTILIEGATSYYRLPGFCPDCDVYGAEYETNCWVCDAHLTIRKSSPGAGTSGGNTSADSPTWRQVMGHDPYTPAEPEPLLFPPPKETTPSGTPSPTQQEPDPGPFSAEAILQYWGGSPQGYGY